MGTFLKRLDTQGNRGLQHSEGIGDTGLTPIGAAMILAISRFRVANDKRDEVEQSVVVLASDFGPFRQFVLAHPPS